MDEKVKEITKQTVLDMINASVSPANIQKMKKKHLAKVHFIPIKYRIIGGILQGLNIKFGNFIETLMQNFVEIDPGIDVMPDSGKKIVLYFTPETDALIDEYITSRQLLNSPDDCAPEFTALLKKILEIEKKASASSRQGITKDVDGFFRTKDGLLIYTELKYNDDHDTGKFADINRKFIKTWAGLAVRHNIQKIDQLIPIIYYFNSTKRYGPIHTPSSNIMRGPQLFDAYLATNYSEIEEYLTALSDDQDILEIYDRMYHAVREMKI